VARRYTLYKKILEKHGFRQLDVYRYKTYEELRLLRLRDREVVLVKLPKRRDEMTPEEFEEVIAKHAAQ